MVQVATMLPAQVLALPAGALADILDRRRMLIGTQLLAALGAGAVLGADLLPRLGARLPPNRLLLVSGAAFTASLLACVLSATSWCSHSCWCPPGSRGSGS
jgi:MFS family permease